ncbi:MAG: PepSY domain-containing protein [Alcanivoracaceae bacterium]|nr:PepSY domain-containing protein [Alcanivoracaceae bacterium]
MGRLIFLVIVLLTFNENALAVDHDLAYQLKQKGKILSLEKIIKISKKTQRGRILEIELEIEDNIFIYEMEILDEKNIVWKIKINATTGQLIEREID